MSPTTRTVRRVCSRGRTPLMRAMRRMLQLANLANQPDSPPADELAEMHRARLVSRRDYLKAAGSVLAAGARPARAKTPPAPPPTRIPQNAHTPRIVVVGTGIAGLHATYRLKLAGYRAQLFGADVRIGGRILSQPNLLTTGTTTELGGEFIDSDHLDMIALTRELGLELLDLDTDPIQREAYFYNGAHLTEAQIIPVFKPLAARIAVQLRSIPDSLSFVNITPTAVRLDRMSLQEYLEGAGVSGMLYQLMRNVALSEEGLELDQQSALNLVTFVGTNVSQGLDLTGSSDERYRVKGGNQQIVEGLFARIADQVALGCPLVAIQSRGAGYLLTFQTPMGPTLDVPADIVILCIPFSTLRQVDVRVPLPPVKTRAINELGYGTNAKVVIGVRERPWRLQGYTGDGFTDEPLQNCWDNSRLEPGPGGGLTVFLGGAAGLTVGQGTVADQVWRYLPGADRLFPGVTAQFNGNASRADWPGQPFIHASYSTYKVGQFTSIGGAQFFPVGNLHFAGEHCNHPDLGYMNGAAATGRLAAQAVLASLRR